MVGSTWIVGGSGIDGSDCRHLCNMSLPPISIEPRGEVGSGPAIISDHCCNPCLSSNLGRARILCLGSPGVPKMDCWGPRKDWAGPLSHRLGALEPPLMCAELWLFPTRTSQAGSSRCDLLLLLLMRI